MSEQSLLNPDDVRELGLARGQWVDLTSHFEGGQRIAKQFMVVPYEIPRKCAATYYPEANPLVPLRHVAWGSNQPASKSIVISITPAAAPAPDLGGWHRLVKFVDCAFGCRQSRPITGEEGTTRSISVCC